MQRHGIINTNVPRTQTRNHIFRTRDNPLPRRYIPQPPLQIVVELFGRTPGKERRGSHFRCNVLDGDEAGQCGGERVLEGKIGVEDLGFASRIGDEGGEFVELSVYPQNTYKSVRKIASGVKEFRQGREDFGAFGEGEEEVVAVLFGEDVGESGEAGDGTVFNVRY